MIKNKDLIPPGIYCYRGIGVKDNHQIRLNCPYWESRDDKPEQDNGYCDFMQRGDWEVDGLSLLWDQVKECGENRTFDSDQEELAIDASKTIEWATKMLAIVDDNKKQQVEEWMNYSCINTRVS